MYSADTLCRTRRNTIYPIAHIYCCTCSGRSGHIIYLAHNVRFLWLNSYLAILKHIAEGYGRGDVCSHLHPLLVTPAHILRDRLALSLCQRGEHGCEHLAGDLAGVDALFLKVHAYAASFQRTHRFKTLGGVTRKSGYGLHEYPVNQPTLTVAEHTRTAASNVAVGLPVGGVQ